MKVLIVDDDMAIVDVIEHTVNWDKLGIGKVYTAYNIDSAREILTEEQIDIVISDIEMPRGSGLELLTWFRQQGQQGEFLLLTCHERFDYATNAIKLHAAEYLLKPFDVVVMEAVLKKLVLKIQEERQMKEDRELGRWAKKNKRKLQLALLDQIMTGYYLENDKGIEQEIENRTLELDAGKEYRLVVTKVTNMERDREKIDPGLILFIMENIHSEMLCDTPENHSVLCYENKNHYVLVTMCEDQTSHKIMERCERLLEGFGNIFSATITCCISNPCTMADFYEVYHKNLRLIEQNVADYGSVFQERMEIEETPLNKSLLEADRMTDLLGEKKKLEFMSALKNITSEMVREHTMNEQVLNQLQHEVLQIVYTYLGKKDISVSGLLAEENLAVLMEKASWSVTDMIRWVNFLLERTFFYEEEMQKKYTIVDQIQQYVREHYQEDIGRSELAEQFHLAPEYLSKMYKKKTGETLKDYINQYRVEQAKLMLEKGERVSDVAETVGFDNFTYFSTMFKKYTGISPNQYRKK